MREIDVEFVRRDIGALRHEAHVAERAGVGDFLVIGLRDGIEFAGRRLVDQVEEAGEGVTEVEATPAGVTDVEHPLHLNLGLRAIGEVRVLPVDNVASRRFEAAFAHGCTFILGLCPHKKGRESLLPRPAFDGRNV
ncbi:MAG: hypothetical protein WAV02_03020 [Stellaceae bacterium]